MTHTYKISGMTCNGCRTDVEKRLNAVNGVTTAAVNLEKEEAVITSTTHTPIHILQEALPDKYSIAEKKAAINVFSTTHKNATATQAATAATTKLQQLQPLIIILVYLTITTLLLNYPRANWDGAMPDFMGLFFIVFSFFKILDLKGFPDSFSMYDPLAQKIPIYARIYPFIETALGLMFLMRLEIQVALIVTLIILGITTIGVTKTLLDKKSIRCACLGTALQLPMTEATFIENAIMIIMAFIMLLGYV